MKRLLTLFLLFPLLISARPCHVPAEPLKHEIGVNLFSVTDGFRWDTYRGAEIDVMLQSLPGVYYKYHRGKNVFRAALDYGQKVTFVSTGIFEGDVAYGGGKEESIRRRGGIRIGYERELGSKKLVPFVAGDLAVSYQHYHGIESWVGCFGWAENEPFTETVTETGLSLGGGLKYKPVPRLAVTLEATAQFYGYHLESDRYQYTHSDNGVGLRVNPVRTLGVSWMF